MNTKERFANEFGEQYDIFHDAVPWHDEFQQTVTDTLLKYFSEKKDLSFLEAGFGTGITTKMVLVKFPDAKIAAIDNVANMEAKATEYIGKENLKNTSFIIGDLYEELTKLPSHSVDAFYSAYVLHNIHGPIREKILSEIYRVLKPGGIYVNADRIAMDDHSEQQDALAQAISNCSVFYTKHNNPEYYLDWVRHYLRDEEPDLIFRAQAQIDTLNKIGFTNAEYIYKHGLEQTCTAIK